MNEHTVKRILSLEKSIDALRSLNRSETLRNDIKERNRDRIIMYVNEIYNDLTDELIEENRSLDYSYIKILGEEIIF